MMSVTAKCLIFFALANVLLVNAAKSEEKEDEVFGPGSGQPCSIDLTKDAAKGQVLYLESSTTKWRYPKGNVLTEGADGHLVRIGCPGGFVQLRDNVTVYKTAVIDCMGGPAVKISDTFMIGPFNQFECSGYQAPVPKFMDKFTSTGKPIAAVGYPLGKKEFLKIIDEVVFSRIASGYIPRWVHYTMQNLQEEEATSQPKKMMKGPFSHGFTYKLAYNRTMQIMALKQAFKDDNIVNLLMPPKGTQAFVPAKLANPEDFYYEAQKNATYYYELSTPVWKTVNEGNWKLLGKLVRNMALQHKKLEVYSGTYLALYLHGKAGAITYIRLPGDLRPAQFLFKFVVDKSAKKGMVMITVNNPYLKLADHSNVICPPIKCFAKQQAAFKTFSSGYTYCCNPADFVEQAKMLGMPTEQFTGLSAFAM